MSLFYLLSFLLIGVSTALDADLIASLSRLNSNFKAFIMEPNPSMEQRKDTVQSWEEFVQHLIHSDKIPAEVATAAASQRSLKTTDDLSGIRMHSPGKFHMDNGNVGEEGGEFTVDYAASQFTGDLGVGGDAEVTGTLNTGTLTVEGSATVHGTDFKLGHEDRGDCGHCRAFVHTSENKLKLNYNSDFDGTKVAGDLECEADLTVAGVITSYATDFKLGDNTGDRGDCGPCRALVHGSDNMLVLNWDTDYTGGTQVEGDLLVTEGLQCKEQYGSLAQGSVATDANWHQIYTFPGGKPAAVEVVATASASGEHGMTHAICVMAYGGVGTSVCDARQATYASVDNRIDVRVNCPALYECYLEIGSGRVYGHAPEIKYYVTAKYPLS